ncbi:MAG: M28 family peptidase [Acidobacteriia bacterium]|nr:M28 family peptidase [Terriglobia bacterium]
MMLRLGAVVCLICFSTTLFAQQLSPQDLAAVEKAMKTIRPEQIRAHIRFLSDSLLQGRAPGTPGYDVAARYVATQLEGMGLQPGLKGAWFQPVPLQKAVVAASTSSVVLSAGGKERKLVDARDYVLDAWFASSGNLPAKEPVSAESDVNAPIVFVGFGVTAPDQNYDDYAGVDVRGKLIATIYGAPSRFPSTERAYYSDGIVKARNAVAHGAVGVLSIMLPEDVKRYPWEWLVPQIQVGEMHWLDKNGTPHDFFPELRGSALLSQQGAEALFAGAPRTLEQAFSSARASQPQSFSMPVSAHIHTVSTQTVLQSPNIIAELKGSDPALRDQYVVYTAHVDHLGTCPAVEGDNVCHGALDNASGTATLLEIARAYASLPRAPRRSVLFVFVTGEEMGLLGSDYFAHFPTVSLKSIVANINIDGAPGCFFSMKDVVALGAEHSTLGNEVTSAARRMGYELSPDPMPEEVSFIRSDQYSFVLQGVPAVDIQDGIKATDPKTNGFDVIKKWLVTRYHTPLDNIDQPIDFESAAKGSALNLLIGYEVAQHDEVPAWNKEDFFGTKFGPRHAGSASAGD